MKVRFTRQAQRDLAQIHAFIGQESSTVAARFVARLVERARYRRSSSALFYFLHDHGG
jgi:plasmid stabilization system protein ParE